MKNQKDYLTETKNSLGRYIMYKTVTMVLLLLMFCIILIGFFLRTDEQLFFKIAAYAPVIAMGIATITRYSKISDGKIKLYAEYLQKLDEIQKIRAEGEGGLIFNYL